MDFKKNFDLVVKDLLEEHTRNMLYDITIKLNAYVQENDRLVRERVKKAEQEAYKYAYERYSTTDFISIEELSKMSMADIADKVAVYAEDNDYRD